MSLDLSEVVYIYVEYVHIGIGHHSIKDLAQFDFTQKNLMWVVRWEIRSSNTIEY